jgi:DNA-binding GntR family transcriptional regulator
VERTAYNAHGVALEFARDLFRGDRTRILLESALPAPVE